MRCGRSKPTRPQTLQTECSKRQQHSLTTDGRACVKYTECDRGYPEQPALACVRSQRCEKADRERARGAESACADRRRRLGSRSSTAGLRCDGRESDPARGGYARRVPGQVQSARATPLTGAYAKLRPCRSSRSCSRSSPVRSARQGRSGEGRPRPAVREVPARLHRPGRHPRDARGRGEDRGVARTPGFF